MSFRTGPRLALVALALLARPLFAEENKDAKPRVDAVGDPLPEGAIARFGTLRLQHGVTVRGVSFSPDGKLLASIGSDAVRVWEVPSGKEKCSFPSPGEPNGIVAFSRTGELLATTDGGRTFLWNVTTGKEARQLAGRFQGFFAEGKLLITGPLPGNQGKAFHVWNPENGRHISQWEGKVKDLAALRVSRDGKTAALADTDSTLHVWSTATGTTLWSAVFDRGCSDLTFSPDGTTLALTDSKDVRLWDVASGTEWPGLAESPLNQYGRPRIFFTGAGTKLGTRSFAGGVHFWDPETGKLLKRLDGEFLGLFHEGRTLVVKDGSVKLYNLATEKVTAELSPPVQFGDTSAISQDGRWLATPVESRVALWDVRSGEEMYKGLRLAGPPIRLAMAPDGETVALMDGWSNALAVGKVKDQIASKLRVCPVPSQLVFSADGKMFAAADQRAINIWDANNWKPAKRITGFWESNGALTFSPDRALLFGVTFPDTFDKGPQHLRLSDVVVWDVTTGKKLRAVEELRSAFQDLSFVGDKLLGVTGSTDPCVFWDVLAKKPLFSLFGRFQTFSPDHKTALLAGKDRFGLWEVSSGKGSLEFGEPRLVTCCAFSNDGRQIVTGGVDGVVRLWSVATGKEIGRLVGHRGAICSLAVSASGNVLVSGSEDTTVLAWDLGRLARKPAPAKEFTAKELDRFWNDLQSDEAPTGHAGTWNLVAGEDTAVAFLKSKLHPARSEDLKRIERLILDLDHEKFSVREAAVGELLTFGVEADRALRKALEQDTSVEVKRRCERVLEKGVYELSGEALRRSRAVQVLEHIGSKKAKELLGALAEGASWSPLTQDARAAIDRLEKRSAKPAE